MHIPHRDLWQEMLSAPQLVRFTFPYNGDDREPTLVIKANSLLLKYVLQGVPLRLFFFPISESYLAYALHIEDDPLYGPLIWSILSWDDERLAIEALEKSPHCSIYLFNEACANVAWCHGKISMNAVSARSAHLYSDNPAHYLDEVSAVCDAIGASGFTQPQPIPVMLSSEWHPIHSHFILNGRQKTTLNLFGDDEGSHQEQLAQTLVGDLSPAGAYLSPKLHEPSGKKELTDVLLTHDFGTVLIESKTLSIFSQRERLPDRAKLAKNISKSVKRAFKQLKDAARKVRDNEPVFDAHGNEINLERSQPIHAIILCPDLGLLGGETSGWINEILEFMKATGGFVQIVDTVQLFRLSQAAGMIANASKSTTPMMAFDYYLIERVKAVMEAKAIDLDMILRIEH